MRVPQRVSFPPPRRRVVEGVVGSLMAAAFGLAGVVGVSVFCAAVVWLAFG